MKKYTFILLILLYHYHTNHAQIQKEWVFSLGGNSSDNAEKIELDNYNNFYIVGNFHETINYDYYEQNIAITSNGSSDIFIIKYNQQHQLLWAKSLGGPGIDRIKDIKIKDNYLIITGFFSETVDFDLSSGVYNLTSNGNYDIFLAKYTLNGDLIWAKHFGGVGPDIGRSIWLYNNDDILLAGDFNSTVDFDPSDNNAILSTMSPSGITDVFFAKYTKEGNFLWVKHIAGNSYSYAQTVAVDNFSNIYLTGTFSKTVDFDPSINVFSVTSKNNSSDIFISKFSPEGNFLWTFSLGSPKNDFITDFSLADSNFYIVGHFQDTINFNPFSTSILKVSSGQHDIFLAKYDLFGILQWVNTFGSTGSDLANSCNIDSTNNIWLVGCFSGTVDFDPTPSIQSLTSMGNYDSFIAQFSSNGNLLYLDHLASTGADKAISLSLNKSWLFLYGSFLNTLNFNISPYSLTSTGLYDLYIAKYRICLPKTYYIFDTINQYQSYYFNNQYLSTSGIYYDTLTNNYGCDSIVILNLYVYETPLPIELLSFNVICTQTGVLIKWTTASETNNNFFTVEKSTDLMNWKIVSTISASFNSNEIKSYTIEDQYIKPNELTYYRLKQTDFDGNFKYFDAYSILCNLPNITLDIIGVNISEQNVNIMIKTNGFAPIEICLYDIYGKRLSCKTMNPTKGANIVTLNNINLSQGIYLICATQNGEKKNKKIILY